MDERSMIHQCQEGDQEAFQLLVKPYIPQLFRTAYLIIRDYQLAEDTVQDALVEVFRTIHRFNEKRGTSFRAWIYKIATHRALNAMRRKRWLPFQQEIPDSALTPLESVLRKEEQLRIWHVVSGLPLKYQSVIILYYFEEFSVGEIAKILGIFEGTVKSRLYTARKKIEQTLTEDASFGIRAMEESK